MKTQPLSLIVRQSSTRPLDIEKFKPIIVNEFDAKATCDFYHDFLKLQADPDVTVIPVIVNSYGGEIYELGAMLDLMDSSVKPVATIGMGKAMSCGASLLASGTKGYRFASPSMDILIHESSSKAWGKNADVQNEAKALKRLNFDLLKQLAHRCGKKTNFFIHMMKKNNNVDLYLTAKEALKLGLVDYIGTPALLER